MDDRLSAVFRTRREPLSPTSIDTLRAALADNHGVLVEQAARVAAELMAEPLARDLAAAFERCLDGRVDDRSLLAASALADALQSLRAHEHELYLRGLKLRKPLLPRGDAAAGVRSACAFGLVRTHYRHDLWEVAALLSDGITECRVAAARAMGMTGSEAALPLLKFKVLAGDAEPEVIVECLTALMSISPALALPFVALQLDAEDERLAEAAALALGESRRAEALSELTARVGGAHSEFRRVLLLAVGLLRTEAGIAYLLDRVANADACTAADAVAAMSLYRHDTAVKARLATAVGTNGAKSVREAFAKELG